MSASPARIGRDEPRNVLRLELQVGRDRTRARRPRACEVAGAQRVGDAAPAAMPHACGGTDTAPRAPASTVRRVVGRAVVDDDDLVPSPAVPRNVCVAQLRGTAAGSPPRPWPGRARRRRPPGRRLPARRTARLPCRMDAVIPASAFAPRARRAGRGTSPPCGARCWTPSRSRISTIAWSVSGCLRVFVLARASRSVP